MGQTLARKIRSMGLGAKSALTLFAAFSLSVFMCTNSGADALLHSSANTSTTYGTWGTGITCATCHNATTNNIKRVRMTGYTSGQNKSIKSVTFLAVTGTNGFGDDRRARPGKSTYICEVCHTQTKYHRYSTAAGAGLTTRDHNNRSDCTKVCHPHDAGFKGKGHNYPYAGAAHMTATGATTPATSCGLAGCHNYTTSGSYPVARGTAPNCMACHKTGLLRTVGTSSCYDCHGSTATNGQPSGNVFPNISANHSGHMAISSVSCATCHYNLGTGSTKHGFSNTSTTTKGRVAFSGLAGTPAWNYSANTCGNVVCHGTISPAWGTRTTGASCVKCHGVAGITQAQYTSDTRTAAPGYNGGRSTSGATAATDAKVGAHAVHLAGSSNYSNPIACAECHKNVSTTNAGFTGHMNGASTPDFGTLANSNGMASTYSSPSCNTYCHFGKPYSSGGVTYTANNSVAWTNTTLLTGTPSLTGDCGKCHASPPATTGSHNGVTAISQCNSCHNHVNTDGTFNDKSKHINGVVDGGCDTCHGFPPTDNGNVHTTHTDNILAEKGLSSIPLGFANNAVCGVCHDVSSDAKHAGSTSTDGTSRNIVPQVAYQFGASAPAYDKGATTTCANMSCHLGASPAWGTPPAACQGCHGYPPTTKTGDPNNKHVAGVTTPVNHSGFQDVTSATTFVKKHGGCQICHGTQDNGSGSHDPYKTYNVATQHATGNININGPVLAPASSSTQYNATTKSCNNACHGNAAPYVMTASGKTLTYGAYGAGGDCVSCHQVAQPSPKAAALNATVSSRVAVSPDFSLASRHIRSRTSSPAVTKYDCCVCHLEGDVATGSPNATYHQDGRINLRDPDTGLNIKGVTHSGSTSAAGAYTSTATDATPVRFSRNLGSATIEADTAAIMVNLCLKCHDANGASSASARLTGATAGRPFGAAIAANPSSNVLDVASQFASTNRSFHPVLQRSNNGYTNTGGSRMVAPWNGVTKTGTTTVYGPLITCWDCHATPGTASTVTLTSSGVHGGTPPANTAVELRGSVYTNSSVAASNLCVYCHVVSGGTTNHGTGSAFTSSVDSGMTYLQNRCYFCHASDVSRTRPWGAGDAHGYNARGGVAGNNGAFPAASNGYAFLRSEGWYGNSYQQVIRSVGATTYSQNCGGRGTTGGGAGACSRSSMGTYGPGGVF